MYKIAIIVALFLSGCSHFKVTAAMCQKLEKEPGATVPQECRAYSKKEADKAFNKVTDKKRVLDSDIEFHKEK